ncbi:NAD(+)/NADH kinase [Candidatus Curtissbacteria bacterium]|nr:NAD(+)/NADH kinase [Candidatus Curtissbacteria bacterium]
MRFGIIASKGNHKAEELSEKIEKYIAEKKHEASSDLAKSDLVIVLGGDGTLLHAACEHVELGVPFVGINVGTLGFLTAAEGDEWRETVDKLISGQYVVSERMTLLASIESSHLRGVKAHLGGDKSGKFRALNEIVVKGMYRVIDLELLVDNQKFISIVGDGVIVSTETGSTAYSLSAGGPIVDPEIDCFLVTPVNAVGLPIPSVALSPEDVVEIKVKIGDDVSLIVDGQEHVKVSKGQSVKVSKGKFRVKFAYFDKHHFLKALNAKFGLALRQSSG